jgi:hypothetical protein
MTLSHVNAGDQVMAADINGIVDGVNALDTSHTFSGLVTANGSPTSLTAAHDVTVNGTLNVPGTLNGNTIQFALGQVTRWSKFTGTATTTSTFFNHGLGAVPDIVLLQLDGTSNTAHSVWADYGSMSSSQVKITADGTNPFVGLAIKF